MQIAVFVGFLLVVLPVVISLSVSHYVYDRSGLYDLSWLHEVGFPQDPCYMINLNAGFDESSLLLEAQFPRAHVEIYDFYNPQRHTEVSIKRARVACPPHPRSRHISTDSLPVLSGTVDFVFAFFSLHEIRNESERQRFFVELARVLRPGGKIVLVEHLRDFTNGLAYTIGSFHFLSERTWLKAFEGAELLIQETRKLNAFVTAFILTHDRAD